MIKKMMALIFVCFIFVGCGNNDRENFEEFATVEESAIMYDIINDCNSYSNIVYTGMKDLRQRIYITRRNAYLSTGEPVKVNEPFDGFKHTFIFLIDSLEEDEQKKVLDRFYPWYLTYRAENHKPEVVKEKIESETGLETVEREKTKDEIAEAIVEAEIKYASMEQVDYLMKYIAEGKCTPAKNALAELFDRDDTSLITVVEYNDILTKVQRCKKVEFNNTINNQ